MKKWKATPRITKKRITAKELLLTIKREVLAEPARANLNTWVTSLGGDDVDYIRTEQRNVPACGTVACLAGWGAVLLRPKGTSSSNLGWRTRWVMEQLVGIKDGFAWETYGLFNAAPQQRFGETAKNFGNPGTVKHARTIGRRIDQYLKAHPELAERVIEVADARQRLAD